MGSSPSRNDKDAECALISFDLNVLDTHDFFRPIVDPANIHLKPSHAAEHKAAS